MYDEIADSQPEIPYMGEDWQDTMLEPRVWNIHAYITVAWIPVGLFWKAFFFFFWVGAVATIIFILFERKGLAPIPALKAIRCYLIGDFRPALPANRRQYWR